MERYFLINIETLKKEAEEATASIKQGTHKKLNNVP
jgi:hypothetical protein